MATDHRQPKIYITRDLIFQIAIIGLCLILPLFFISKVQILPFVMIMAVITGLLILKKPFIGLLLYLFIFYIRPQEIWLTGVVGLEKVVGIAMLVLTLLKLKLKDDFRFKITNIHIAIFAFLIVALVNVALSFWIGQSWQLWVDLFRLTIVFFCVIHLIDNEKQFKIFILFTILATVFHAASAVIRYYQGIVHIEMGIERAFAMDTSYGFPNSLAATIVYTLPLVFYYFTKKTSLPTRIFLGLSILLLFWCVVLTGSRTGMAGVIVFGLIYIWQRKNKLRNFLIIGAVLVIIAVVMPSEYQQRFISITNLDTEHDATGAATSARSRFTFMVYAVEMFLERPLFGYGMGNFAVAMGIVYDRAWLQAHTLPAQILSEMGATGVAAFAIWMIFLFQALGKLRRYFAATNNRFMLNMTMAMKANLLLMFFMGLGGHNLFRYNWFIISATVVLLMNPRITGYGTGKIEDEVSNERLAGSELAEVAGNT